MSSDTTDHVAEGTAAAGDPTAARSGERSSWRRRAGELGPTLSLLIVLTALIALFSALNPATFPTLANFRNIALDASVLLVLAVGLTFVIISGGIDIAVGSVLVFSAVIAARVMSSVSVPLGLLIAGGLAGALLAGSAWGLLHGVLIAKARLPSLIVTLGTLGMALGAALLLTDRGADITDVPPPIVDHVGNGLVLGQIPVLVVVAAVVALIGGIILTTTRFGRHVYAIGSNAEAARRVGIAVDRRLIAVYVVGGTLSGLAGFLALVRFSTTSVSGHSNDALGAITAVILGGTSLFGGSGTVQGTVLGVLIPAVLTNGLVVSGLEPFWQQVAVGAVLILAVFADQVRRSRRFAGRA